MFFSAAKISTDFVSVRFKNSFFFFNASLRNPSIRSNRHRYNNIIRSDLRRPAKTRLGMCFTYSIIYFYIIRVQWVYIIIRYNYIISRYTHVLLICAGSFIVTYRIFVTVVLLVLTARISSRDLQSALVIIVLYIITLL